MVDIDSKAFGVATRILNNDHGLCITAHELHLFRRVAYLSTKECANLLGISYHRFTNNHTKMLRDVGVCRVVVGKNKYYHLPNLLKVLNRANKAEVSVFEMCKTIKERSDSTKKRNKAKRKK